MLVLLTLWVSFSFASIPYRVPGAALRDKNITQKCPLSTTDQPILKDEIRMILQSNFPDTPETNEGWTEIINFDMTNSSHSCPPPWTIVNSPSRLCAASSCSDSVTFNVPTSYSCIRGQVIGQATGLPDAFFLHNVSNPTIEMGYLDGVSITHGHPRQHIWSLAAGHGEPFFRCLCDNNNNSVARLPPSFVGNNYFCDGPYNGLLWDRQGCTTACCTVNSPPWFNVTLPGTIKDPIEVRICSDEDFNDERIYIKKLTIQIN